MNDSVKEPKVSGKKHFYPGQKTSHYIYPSVPMYVRLQGMRNLGPGRETWMLWVLKCEWRDLWAISPSHLK